MFNAVRFSGVEKIQFIGLQGGIITGWRVGRLGNVWVQKYHPEEKGITGWSADDYWVHVTADSPKLNPTEKTDTQYYQDLTKEVLDHEKTTSAEHLVRPFKTPDQIKVETALSNKLDTFQKIATDHINKHPETKTRTFKAIKSRGKYSFEEIA